MHKIPPNPNALNPNSPISLYFLFLVSLSTMKTTNTTTAHHHNNNNTKLILLHPYILKQGSSNRLWLLAFISLFTLIFLLTLIFTRDSFAVSTSTDASATTVSAAVSAASLGGGSPLPKHVMSTLLHYASNANTTEKMGIGDLKSISDVLRRCPTPCNFLVFGLTHETLLWRALNSHGRTVFIDENRYFVFSFGPFLEGGVEH